MHDWRKILKSLGFNDSEAIIYLTSLELGPASANELAIKSKFSRVTTYASIESLTQRGLMGSLTKGKFILYHAESPERLESFIAGQVHKMENTLKQIKEDVGELKLLQRGEKPVVKMYEGEEALRVIQEDLLESKPKKIDECANFDVLRALYPVDEARKKFFIELAKHKPQARGVGILSDESLISPDPESLFHRLGSEKHKFYGDLVVYGNKVALSTLRGKQIAILIENQDIADTVRALFDALFEKHSQK